MVGITWWMFSFPARLSADSLETLGYIKLGIFSQTHSVLYQLFISITSLGGRFVGISTLVQVALMVYAVGRFLKVVFCKVSERDRQIIRIILIGSPFGGGISTTIWVDSLSVIMFLLFISRVIELQRLFNFKKLLLTYLLGIIFVGLRPETFFVLLLSGLLVVLASKSKSTELKASNGIQIIAIAIFGFVNVLTINYITDSEPAPRFYKVAAPLHDLAYTSQILNDETLERNLPNIIGEEGLRGSEYCPTSVPFLFAPGNKFSDIEISNYQVYKLWLLEFFDHPKELLSLHICRAATFIPPPLSFSAKYVYLIHPGVDQNLIGYSFRPLILLNSSVVDFLNFILTGFLKFVFWPGMLLLISTLLVISRKANITKKSHFAMIYIWSNAVVLFLVATAGDFRYGLNIVFVALPIILVFFLERLKKLRE
jgi:hypothetical protein